MDDLNVDTTIAFDHEVSRSLAKKRTATIVTPSRPKAPRLTVRLPPSTTVIDHVEEEEIVNDGFGIASPIHITSHVGHVEAQQESDNPSSSESGFEVSLNSEGPPDFPDEDQVFVSCRPHGRGKVLRPRSTSTSQATPLNSAHASAERQQQIRFVSSSRHTSGGSTTQPTNVGETILPTRSSEAQPVQVDEPQVDDDPTDHIDPTGLSTRVTSTGPSLGHDGAPRALSHMGFLLADTTVEPHLRETMEFYYRLHPEMLHGVRFSSLMTRDSMLTCLGKTLHSYRKLMPAEVNPRRYKEIIGPTTDLGKLGINLKWMVDNLYTFKDHLNTPSVSKLLRSRRKIAELRDKLNEAEATIANLRAQLDTEERKEQAALDNVNSDLGTDFVYRLANGVGEEPNVGEVDA